MSRLSGVIGGIVVMQLHRAQRSDEDRKGSFTAHKPARDDRMASLPPKLRPCHATHRREGCAAVLERN
jgi:hypothetical protein